MKNILGKRIELERTRLGLNQIELAKKLNLSSSASISQYEKGDRVPSDDIKLKMAEIFNCSLDYLLGKSEIRNPDELKKVPFANAGGLNTDGLDEEDLLTLQKQIDYIKKLKEKK
jgi:transcriptional regulator with XRE-family HTH domain